MVEQAAGVVMRRNLAAMETLHQLRHRKVITVEQVQHNRNRMAVAVVEVRLLPVLMVLQLLVAATVAQGRHQQLQVRL